MGFRVSGLAFRVLSFVCRFYGFGCGSRVEVLGFLVQGSWFGVLGLGFTFEGLGAAELHCKVTDAARRDVLIATDFYCRAGNNLKTFHFFNLKAKDTIWL